MRRLLAPFRMTDYRSHLRQQTINATTMCMYVAHWNIFIVYKILW